MAPSKLKTLADSAAGLWMVALFSFIIAALYLGRDVLIPIFLAALLTFLLAPIVARLERWLGRVAAVLLVVALIFSATGATGYVLTRQVMDLATKLPDYKENIRSKLRSLRAPEGGTLSKISDTIKDLKKDLPGGEDAAPEPKKEPEAPETATPPAPPAPPEPAVPVKIVEQSTDPMELLRSIVAPLLGPIGTMALVLLLLIFMLLKREDLRSRVIRLIGEGHISATTRAMVDAGDRVSRYLLMQLVVNVTYGVPVAVGLYFIGVPNAVLWGAFAIVLRFVPYVGPWIAAAIPVVLSLAVSPGWIMPLLTIALFVVLELLSNNVMEPWLYGSSTGVSSMALIIAAIFWTWLWGPVGLVLATPLTVCLVVMGRHIPRLAFLSVVLSDEEALTPAQDCYHRILTVGEQDEMELIEGYLKANSLAVLYDQMLLPVVAMAEMDARLGELDTGQRAQVEQSVRDIIDDLGTRPPPPVEPGAPAPAPAPPFRIYCLPARAPRDELAGIMLAQLLRQQGFEPQSAPARLVAGERLKLVEESRVDAVCISVVPPSTIIHARYLCTRLRAAFPQLKILIGLWGTGEDLDAAARRLRESGADEVVNTLPEAVAKISRLARESAGAPPPAGEEGSRRSPLY